MIIDFLSQKFVVLVASLLAVACPVAAPAGNLTHLEGGSAVTVFSLELPFKSDSRWQSWRGDPNTMIALRVKDKIKLFGVSNQKFLFQPGDSWFIYGLFGRTKLSDRLYGPHYANAGKQHPGMDFVAVPDQAVIAAGSGRVIFVGNLLGGSVAIDHGNGFVSLYGYLSKIKVKPGIVVKTGQEIGKVADPRLGSRFAGHLHFEVDHIDKRGDSRALDPIKFMNIDKALLPITGANLGDERP